MFTIRVDELIRLLGVKILESHDKYLGLSTLLEDQKPKFSSFFEIVLIKSVVQFILTYVMDCFLLPQSICHEIESLTACFY